MFVTRYRFGLLRDLVESIDRHLTRRIDWFGEDFDQESRKLRAEIKRLQEKDEEHKTAIDYVFRQNGMLRERVSELEYKLRRKPAKKVRR